MKTGKILYSLLGAAALLLASCDDIVKDQRLEYVPPVKASRAVLVEEFSGQLCVNCPYGADLLEQMEEQYGADTAIVVSFHTYCNGLGLRPGGKYPGLVTTDGDNLFARYQGTALPAAALNRTQINGRYLVNEYNAWPTYINYLLQQPTDLTLQVKTSYDEQTRRLAVNVTSQLAAGATADLSGSIHVWLTEDSIVAPQKLPSGGYEFDHVYNSIYRASVNNFDGDAISVSRKGATGTSYETTLSEDWNAKNMNVVVFVDNAGGVVQAAKAKVTANK